MITFQSFTIFLLLYLFLALPCFQAFSGIIDILLSLLLKQNIYRQMHAHTMQRISSFLTGSSEKSEARIG
jgi:hypothetical protein